MRLCWASSCVRCRGLDRVSPWCLELYHVSCRRTGALHYLSIWSGRPTRLYLRCVTRAFSCHFIELLFRGGPAARGELPNQRGSAGMEAVRLRCAWQSVQAGRSSREARLPGQQSASRHASALWACRLLAGDAGAAGRLRGTSTCALLATRRADRSYVRKRDGRTPDTASQERVQASQHCI